MKRIIVVLIMVVVICTLSSCMAQAQPTTTEPAGFFMGIWHGWIAPIALIVRLFNPDIRIYETNNTGWWYEAGFYIAIIGGFGGISLARGRKHRDK